MKTPAPSSRPASGDRCGPTSIRHALSGREPEVRRAGAGDPAHAPEPLGREREGRCELALCQGSLPALSRGATSTRRAGAGAYGPPRARRRRARHHRAARPPFARAALGRRLRQPDELRMRCEPAACRAPLVYERERRPLGGALPAPARPPRRGRAGRRRGPRSTGRARAHGSPPRDGRRGVEVRDDAYLPGITEPEDLRRPSRSSRPAQKGQSASSASSGSPSPGSRAAGPAGRAPGHRDGAARQWVSRRSSWRASTNGASSVDRRGEDDRGRVRRADLHQGLQVAQLECGGLRLEHGARPSGARRPGTRPRRR